MTLRKTLTIISLALTSTVLTSCGDGAGTKVECSRPQDAFNSLCTDAKDLASIDNRLRQCLTDSTVNPTYCAEIIAVDTNDIGDYADLPTGLPTGENTAFVRVTGNSLGTEGLGATSDPVIQRLAGNNDDGYIYAFGTNGAIAAILPDTDLGAPVFAQTGAATWTGTYSLSDLASNLPISFAINFGTGTMTGTATTRAGVALTTNTKFNEYGAIAGTFSVATLNDDGTNNPITGDVMGLIGTQGTVGVFHGTNSKSTDFHAGGFIASPPAQ